MTETFPAPCVEELLSIARRYWRADKQYYDLADSSPENLRLQARWREALERMDEWRALLGELRKDLPGHTIGNATAPCDSGFRCSVYLPMEEALKGRKSVVVGCMSILAPIYTVYGVQYEYRGKKLLGSEVFLEQLPPPMLAPAATIARRIESTFGVSALPHELAATRIPLFVEFKAPPETTLFHALFTNEPQSVP